MLREEGFELTLASRTAEKVDAAATELGATAIAADVSKPEDCERVVREHVDRSGGLDLLVNSAGIGIAARVEDAQLKHIDRQLNINLRGLVLVSQALTHSLNADLDDEGVRAIALCPGFVDTPMAEFAGLAADEMIQPEDCAEVVRMCLRLSPRARVPQVVIERVGSSGKIA